MKLSRFNLSILLSENKALADLEEELREAGEAWMESVNRREEGSSDWLTKGRRERLERLLTEYRFKLAAVYDFMGDRGMVDFAPTGYASELGVEDVSSRI